MSYGPLVVSLNGYHVNQEEEARILQHPLIGGVILYSQNYQNKDQLKQLTQEIKSLAHESDKELMVMVDHEGGYVQRFRTGFSAAPAAKVIGDIYDINAPAALNYAQELGLNVGQELKSVGIDIVLGPVVDLDNGNAVISGLDRAYHHDPKVVTEIASAYIGGLNASGIHATLKHFPGHGQNIGDSHKVEPIDTRGWEELKNQDLVPFQNLVDKGIVNAIMPAHVTYPEVDSANTAGTSQIWLKDILRTQMHFDGVVISDCLSMTGAGQDNNVNKTLKALDYGDIALFSHQSPQQYLDLLQGLEAENFTWSPQSQERVQHWLAPVLSIDTSDFI